MLDHECRACRAETRERSRTTDALGCGASLGSSVASLTEKTFCRCSEQVDRFCAMSASICLHMLDQSGADPGRADLWIDHQRPQESMAAEQLQTYDPHRRLRLPCHEEVLQM